MAARMVDTTRRETNQTTMKKSPGLPPIVRAFYNARASLLNQLEVTPDGAPVLEPIIRRLEEQAVLLGIPIEPAILSEKWGGPLPFAERVR
jgi:hypothetical protein